MKNYQKILFLVSLEGARGNAQQEFSEILILSIYFKYIFHIRIFINFDKSRNYQIGLALPFFLVFTLTLSGFENLNNTALQIQY